MDVGIREAKNKLSSLIEAARNGEEVNLTSRGQRVARLLPPVKAPEPQRVKGILKGTINFYEGWDSPEEDKRIEEMFEFLRESD